MDILGKIDPRNLPLSALILAMFSFPAHAVKYELIELDFSTGNQFSLNDLGQVAGETSNPTTGNTEAFYYNSGSLDYIVDIANNSGSSAWSLNNSGQVVGAYYTDSYQQRAFLYDNGTVIDIGNLGPTFDLSLDTGAQDINETGDIVGSSRTESGGPRHAYVYSNGSMQDLGTLGGTNSGAFAINENGQIAGFSDMADGGRHGFIYENGIMVDIGTLGDGMSISPIDINNSGQVLGYFFDDNGSVQSFIYENGVMQQFGTLGGDWTSMYAINDAGQAVGASSTGGFDRTPILYENGIMIELCSLVDCDAAGLELDFAFDINERGDIIGMALKDVGGQLTLVPYMMKVVPLPAAAYLFGSGLVLLAGFSRRSKNA